MSIVKDYFLKYIQIDTQSDHNAESYPSTAKQLDFAKILADDCRALGLSDVEEWDEGYVTATIPATIDGEYPVIGLLAHMDTAPDCSGAHVKPILHQNYDGGDVVLPNGLVLSPAEFPGLKTFAGQTLITTDGTTLLGADDKAGIAEILALADTLLQNPQIPHGKIRIAFTPDEEVGRGVDFFDVKRFGADYAYTVDGMALGELEYECFHAARAKVTFNGKSVHPGYAKDVMVNAAQIAIDFAGRFPADETPATTEGREGYYHLNTISGGVECAKADWILRDFTKEGMAARKDFVLGEVLAINEKYGAKTAVLNLYDEYANMADVLVNKMYVVDRASEAMQAAGITPVVVPIRGGTDGARLSYMGLPCPNIFTGGLNAHGPYECITVEAMEKAVEVLVNLVRI